MQVQLGFGTKFRFQGLDQIINVERKKQIGHILETDVVRAHIFELLAELYEIFLRIDGARRIANRGFTDAAVFFDGLHRGFEISRIVERVENTHDADAVPDGFFNKLFDEIVRIVTIPQKVLASQKHLNRRLFEMSLQNPQPFPGILVEETQTGVKRSSAPRFEGIIADIVQLFQNGKHFVQPHSCCSLRLMRIAQNCFRNQYFSVFSFYFHNRFHLYTLKQRQQEACGERGADNPRDVGPIACISK